jgi:hypothetical protein
MTGTPKAFRDPRKKRRLNPGRRRSPQTDAPKPMADDELHEIERTFARLRDLEPIHRKDADAVVRLVAAFRRLRKLVGEAVVEVDAIADSEGLTFFNHELLSRLRAEVDRWLMQRSR